MTCDLDVVNELSDTSARRKCHEDEKNSPFRVPLYK
jgi:hypothetical protein